MHEIRLSRHKINNNDHFILEIPQHDHARLPTQSQIHHRFWQFFEDVCLVLQEVLITLPMNILNLVGNNFGRYYLTYLCPCIQLIMFHHP